MEKIKADELKKFLKNRAKELRSDFNDVPEWVISASAEFFNSQINEDKELLKNLRNCISNEDGEEQKAILNFLKTYSNRTEFAHGFEFEHEGKIVEIIMWQPLENFTIRQLANHIGL